MIVEIEISDDELRAAFQERVSDAVHQVSRHFGADAVILRCVKERWDSEVMGKMIDEALSDTEALKSKVNAVIEKRLRSQVLISMRKLEALENGS